MVEHLFSGYVSFRYLQDILRGFCFFFILIFFKFNNGKYTKNLIINEDWLKLAPKYIYSENIRLMINKIYSLKILNKLNTI